MERKAKATRRAADFLDQRQGQPENREKAGTQQKAFIHSITKVSIQHSARKHFRLKGCSTVGIAGGVNESIPQVRHKPLATLVKTTTHQCKKIRKKPSRFFRIRKSSETEARAKLELPGKSPMFYRGNLPGVAGRA